MKSTDQLMAWNEPGNSGSNGDGDRNGNRGKDPWGQRNSGDGPPDFDEILRNLFGGLFGRKKSGSGPQGGSSLPLVVIVVLGLVGLYVAKGFGIVNEQERAVVLRLGSYYATVQPGLRWNPPFIDTVFKENVTRVRLWSTEEEMLTQDLNIVTIKMSVQYSINSAEDFVLRVKSPEDSLQQAANSALRHVVGSTRMHDVLTEGRAAIAGEVQKRLQDYLDSYTTGILVNKVNIEESRPPKEVQESFDDVIKAREDEERFQSEAKTYRNSVVPKAEGEATRMKEAAQAYKQEVVARAQGEAARFGSLLTEYSKAPEVTRQRLYIESMQEVMQASSKVMIDVKDGNSLLYLPLDKLTEAAAATGARRGLNRQELEQISSQIKDQVLTELPAPAARRSSR